MIDIQRLRTKADTFGIVLDDDRLEKIQQYISLLDEWNGKINLTAVTEPEDVENKHIIDSLLLAIQPEVEGTMVDVGSGAGLPGLICKIWKPGLAVTLMEPTQKRARFLQECVDKLHIESLIVTERAEEAARKQHREIYDVATARAVAALPALCEYCLPLVRVGGYFLAMKGEAQEELDGAQNAIRALGGVVEDVRRFTLADGSKRNIIVIRKEKATEQTYPRQGAKIKRKPL